MIDRSIRVGLLCVAAVACHSGDHADKTAGNIEKPIATPADAKPVAVEIELLHGSDAKVAVSSVVANATIFPSDLVDGKMSTAWNSRTGDLQGAWLAFRVPAAAHVTHIRLTAGFANVHGSDDWFTMNYRIGKVHVMRGETDLGVHTLEPQNRGLQDIQIDGPGGDYKITITDVVPGTKTNWRETCVSELEVWGTLPAKTPARHEAPDVSVGSLDAEPLPDSDITIDPLPGYASVDAFCKDYLARPAESFTRCDPFDSDCVVQGKRACGEVVESSIAIGKLPTGWTSARFFYTQGEHRKQRTCNLAFAAGAKTYVLANVGDGSCGHAVDISGATGRTQSRAESTLKGDVLAITTTTSTDTSMVDLSTETTERLWLCSASEPACTSEILLGSYTLTRRSEGGPGADGVVMTQVGWSFDWSLDGRTLALSHHDGTVPREQHDRLGAHRIVLPNER